MLYFEHFWCFTLPPDSPLFLGLHSPNRLTYSKCSCAPHYAADQLFALDFWCVPLYSELGENKTSNTERCIGTTIRVQVENLCKSRVVRIC